MGSPDDPADEEWFDEHAGPMVRPYVMTRGRIQPVRGKFDLISLVEATGPVPEGELGLSPEHLAIIRVCQEPMSVAEIAGHLDLPAGTIRVLLGDLLDGDFVAVQEPQSETDVRDDMMYEVVIDALRSL